MSTATQPLFKPGDRALYSFEEVTIEEVEDDGRVRSVCTDYIRSGGYNLRCFPVTPRGKEVASFFKMQWDDIHKTGLGLNYPDLASKACRLFEEAMRLIENEDVRLYTALEAGNQFFLDLRNKIGYLQSLEVQGIKLLRVVR